jgi:hypothetical protein
MVRKSARKLVFHAQLFFMAVPVVKFGLNKTTKLKQIMISNGSRSSCALFQVSQDIKTSSCMIHISEEVTVQEAKMAENGRK